METTSWPVGVVNDKQFAVFSFVSAINYGICKYYLGTGY